jgi:hypothetical protein
MKVKSNKAAGKEGWLHSKGIEFQNVPIPPTPTRISDEELAKKWSPLAATFASKGLSLLPKLSAQLGVDTSSLIKLNVGFSEELGAWTWPERNARGWIVGIVRRLVAPTDGRGKLCCKGSRRGLTYCDGWHDALGPIYLCEGGSDVAAGLSINLCIVGRPSNTGGVPMLSQLLKPHVKRRIIVLGERDRKTTLYVKQKFLDHNPKCRGCLQCWPGKAGAIQTAKELAERLNTQIAWKLPPAPFKDLREWVKSKEGNDGSRSLQEIWLQDTNTRSH